MGWLLRLGYWCLCLFFRWLLPPLLGLVCLLLSPTTLASSISYLISLASGVGKKPDKAQVQRVSIKAIHVLRLRIDSIEATVVEGAQATHVLIECMEVWTWSVGGRPIFPVILYGNTTERDTLMKRSSRPPRDSCLTGVSWPIGPILALREALDPSTCVSPHSPPSPHLCVLPAGIPGADPTSSTGRPLLLLPGQAFRPPHERDPRRQGPLG